MPTSISTIINDERVVFNEDENVVFTYDNGTKRKGKIITFQSTTIANVLIYIGKQKKIIQVGVWNLEKIKK